jgi:hypothetical protein
MQCPHEEETLSAFVDEETPASSRRALARHLLTCEKCAAEVGRLLAVQRYLTVEPEPAPDLSPDFWQRLSRALRLTDEVVHTAPRAQRRWQPRLALASAMAAALILLMVGVNLRPSEPPLSPGALAQAHRSLEEQPAWPGLPQALSPLSPPTAPLQPAAWNSRTNLAANGTWVPHVNWGQRDHRSPVPHEVYSGSPVLLSRFALPLRALDVRDMERVRVGEREYYAARQGATSMLAWLEGEEWQVLAADVPLETLRVFAELHGTDPGN